MIKAQYIEYRGKKYPLALTIDVAEKYMNETQEDFSTTIVNGVGTTPDSIHQYKIKMILMLAYMLEEGALLVFPKWKLNFNKLIHKSYSGISQSTVIDIYKFCSNDFVEAVLKFLFTSKKMPEQTDEGLEVDLSEKKS